MAIVFNSKIGSVNFLLTNDTITPEIKTVKPAIKYRKLFEIFLSKLEWFDKDRYERIGITVFFAIMPIKKNENCVGKIR